jgi:Protein of unknown function (DUF4058)
MSTTSPFPGMDPFIEACGLWEDFHGHLIEKISEVLADTLPARYLVKTGERGSVVLADADGEKSHTFKPDVSVVDDGSAFSEAATALAEPAIAKAPYSLRAFIEEEFRERFIEIYGGEGETQLVTCIEVLSPSNKKPNTVGRDRYQRKRQGLFLGHEANLVEIDLLRGGERMPMIDRLPISPYMLLVSRKQHMPYCQVWDAYFDRPLPPIPVPLARPDPDVSLDLQPMIDSIYSRWRFSRSIDYAKALTPPLTVEETAWLQEQLRQRSA